MLASIFVTIRRLSAAFAVLLCGVLVTTVVTAACGDGAQTPPPGDGADSSPSPLTAAGNRKTQTAAAAGPTQEAKPTPTPDSQPYPGPAPKLGGNVKGITPANGQAITQLDSQSPNPERPRGVCVEADFTDLPQNVLWFRVAVDGAEVTEKLTVLVASRDSPTGGRLCYAPKEGLPVGRHTAAVSVQNPSNPNEPPKQLVSWRFEVTK